MKSSEEQKMFYEENPYWIELRGVVQQMVNEGASCKCCNDSLTFVDDDHFCQSLCQNL